MKNTKILTIMVYRNTHLQHEKTSKQRIQKMIKRYDILSTYQRL
jgi:hypothetical protein